MKLITGVSGRTGGEVATTLLSKNERIRVLCEMIKMQKSGQIVVLQGSFNILIL